MLTRSALAMMAALAVGCLPAHAASFAVTVDGADAIFLAGRTDLTIPPADQEWAGPGDFLLRHGFPTPEEIREQVPPFISVMAGDVVRVLDPAVGGVSFFLGTGGTFFGPSGNAAQTSSLTALGGISGYIGPQGPLTGVFLTNAVPDGSPPATLDFSGAAARDQASLSPGLGQVFYIGDGLTSGGVLQQFIAPTGATRLFFGIPDGFSFLGPPGAYDDNDGSYRIVVGVNEIPQIPEPSTYALMALGLGLLALARRRRA